MKHQGSILSLADARIQLRVDQVDAEVDAAVTAAIEDAMAWVALRSGIPLIDRERMFVVDPPVSPLLPIVIPSQDVKGITRVAYWSSTSGTLRADPDGAWGSGADDDPLTDLGRLDKLSAADATLLYPPAAGWPTVLNYSQFLITADVGYTLVAAGVDPVRRAVIVAARAFFENTTSEAARRALDSIIGPITRV